MTLPAVISVGDAINEPRYPSLKAIMGAKKKPLETVVDVLDTIIAEHGHRYAILGGGLLGFEIGAGFAARREAAVTTGAGDAKGRPLDAALVALDNACYV
ncbi:MAG: hypothetical protein M0T77_00725 [Actinomycetota bacterium]|nr:hypothetical protein [Actinomycetota bacterium]